MNLENSLKISLLKSVADCLTYSKIGGIPMTAVSSNRLSSGSSENLGIKRPVFHTFLSFLFRFNKGLQNLETILVCHYIAFRITCIKRRIKVKQFEICFTFIVVLICIILVWICNYRTLQIIQFRLRECRDQDSNLGYCGHNTMY